MIHFFFRCFTSDDFLNSSDECLNPGRIELCHDGAIPILNLEEQAA